MQTDRQTNAFVLLCYSDKRGSPPGEYRSASYKVNKKLEVMEKMGELKLDYKLQNELLILKYTGSIFNKIAIS